MIVTDERSLKKSFDEVNVGEVFVRNGAPCMKTEGGDTVNVVCLETGVAFWLDFDEEVEEVEEVELILK